MARHTETDVWGKGGNSGEHLFLSCDGAFPLDLRGVLVQSCLVPPRSQCAPTARQGRQGDCVLGTRRVSSRQLPVWPLVGRSTLCVARRRRRVLLCWTDWLARPRAASGPGATHRAHLISPQGEANYKADVSRRRPLGGPPWRDQRKASSTGKQPWSGKPPSDDETTQTVMISQRSRDSLAQRGTSCSWHRPVQQPTST